MSEYSILYCTSLQPFQEEKERKIWICTRLFYYFSTRFHSTLYNMLVLDR